jgi:hypothetical protein
MIETLFGGLLGGVFRLAPEVLKFFDRANERKHEAQMLELQIQHAKIQADHHVKVAEYTLEAAELDAMGVALEEQGRTARAAGKIIAALSALVRPAVTYAFVIAYFLVKFAAFGLAMDQDGNWREVLLSIWNQDDMAMLSLILTFWFVGRVMDRRNNA